MGAAPTPLHPRRTQAVAQERWLRRPKRAIDSTLVPQPETGGGDEHQCLSAPIVKVSVLCEVAEPTSRPKELSGELHLGLECDVSV